MLAIAKYRTIKNFISPQIELFFLLILLMVCNLHLVTGNTMDALVFYSIKTEPNSLLRLILHPFVHVSWYHFLLDASAFIFLYFELDNTGILKKTAYISISGCVSFIFLILFNGKSMEFGFCGLSGIAHGLFAILCLEMIFSNTKKKLAVTMMCLICFKCTYEIISGEAIFSFFHMGLCGQPLPSSHLGGFLGGLVSFILVNPTVIKKSILSQTFYQTDHFE